MSCQSLGQYTADNLFYHKYIVRTEGAKGFEIDLHYGQPAIDFWKYMPLVVLGKALMLSQT